MNFSLKLGFFESSTGISIDSRKLFYYEERPATSLQIRILTMPFEILPKDVWKLAPTIGEERLSRLWGATFEEIVALFSSASLCSGVAKQKRGNGRRTEVAVQLPASVVDLFHNGAGGYRAQFLAGIENGERANRYVIDFLLRAHERELQGEPRAAAFCRASMAGPHAKVWIHEGAWLSDNRQTDRNLMVDLWENNAHLVGRQLLGFEPIWARLTPEQETIIEIKGCWLSDDFEYLPDSKPSRSQEIQRHGYT